MTTIKVRKSVDRMPQDENERFYMIRSRGGNTYNELILNIHSGYHVSTEGLIATLVSTVVRNKKTSC